MDKMPIPQAAAGRANDSIAEQRITLTLRRSDVTRIMGMADSYAELARKNILRAREIANEYGLDDDASHYRYWQEKLGAALALQIELNAAMGRRGER